MDFFILAKPKPDSLEDRDGRSDAIKEEGSQTGEALRCPNCNRYLSSLVWLPPYRIELESWGRHYADIAEISYQVVVSERFVSMFEGNDLKGLSSFEPVEVVRLIHRRAKPDTRLPRYFTALVSRSSTTVDQEASGFVWRDESKVCPVCLFDDLKRYARIAIRPETWNGDDIFFPRGGTSVMVSERFKMLFEKHELRGAVFKLPQCESYDYYPWEAEAEENA